MPVKVEVVRDAQSMSDFMLYHIYTSGAGIMTLVMGVLNIGLTVSFALKGRFTYMIIFLLFALLILVVFPYMIKSKVRRQMTNSSNERNRVTYEFADDGITTTTVDDSGRASWSKFKKAVSYKSVVILYDASKRAIILPVEQLGENYDPIVDLIYSHMPAPSVRIRRADAKR